MSNLRKINDYILWDEKAKRFLPIYWKREVQPKWLAFDAGVTAGAVNIPAAAAGLAARTNFFQPYWSLGLDQYLGNPFEVRSLVFADSTDGTAAANWTVFMRDDAALRNFMNAPIHIRTFAGTAQTPAVLREPYFFLSSNKISVTFLKQAGGAVNARLFLVGAEYFPWSPQFMSHPVAKETITRIIRRWMERRKYVQPYWLTTEQPVNLVAGAAPVDFYFRVGDDGHFQGFTATAISTGNFSWELSEARTSQTLMNGVATQTNSLGTANFPTMFPAPYTLFAGYRLRLRLQDLSGAPNAVYFTLAGRKVYAPKKDVNAVVRDTAVPTMADTMAQIVPPPMVRDQPLVKA